MFGNKKCGRMGASVTKSCVIDGDSFSIIDLCEIRMLRDQQRDVARRCLQIYRLWRVTHNMITNKYERQFSEQKGEIYQSNLISEYKLYKVMARDYKRIRAGHTQ